MPKFTKQQRKTIDKIYSTLKKAGFDDISIAGMLGNALSESSFDPDSVSKSNYHGLWQNSKDLHNAIVGLYGNHDIDTQLQYVMDWVDGSEKVTKSKYRDWLATGAGKYKKQGYKSATDAADAFMKLYERPVILDKSGNIVGYQKDRERKDNAAVMYDYINSTYSGTPNSIIVAESPNGNRVMKFDKEFWNTPEELTPYNQTPELVKYWMNYKDPTQYPIVNKTPQYLSSTNAADAPNGRITGPSLIRDIHNQDIMNREAVRDAFERGATVWGNKNYLPSLSEVMQDNVKDYAKDIMFANPFYGSEIEYKPLRYKDGKDLPGFYKGKTPRTTSGGYAPTPMPNVTVTPDNEVSKMLENYADLIPFVGSVRDWEAVADGDISNAPSATISTVSDLFLPKLFTSYKGIGALKRLAESSAPKTSMAIKSAYNASKKAVKDFKNALAWQLAGAYEDALQYYNNTLK